MIDTHSHLFDEAFSNDIQDCIVRAKQVGIAKIILVGFSDETNQLAQDLAAQDKIFYPTAGIHPSEATKEYAVLLGHLIDFVNTNKVYAIGECGLDYHYGTTTMEEQKILFEEQIKLAKRYNLPLIVHMRDATQDTYEIMKKYKGKIRGVMHCYSGSWEMAQEFIKLGFYISIGGPITYKNAKESKRIASQIDLSKLLVETDCPYLPPVPYRGQRNESSYVAKVIEEIALIRGMTFEEIEIITTKNAIELFHLED